MARMLEHQPHPPAVLRGARRRPGALRVELPEAAPAHQARGERPPTRSREKEATIFSEPFLIRRPLLQAITPGRQAAGAADRRDRPGGRGVRGLPARGALRLPGDDPRDRHDQGDPSAPRHPHLEPRRASCRTRSAGAASTCGSTSRASTRKCASSRARCPGSTSALAREIARFMETLRTHAAGQGAGRGRDARLGAGAGLAARRPPRRGPGRRDARLRPQGRRRHQALQARAGARAGSSASWPPRASMAGPATSPTAVAPLRPACCARRGCR